MEATEGTLLARVCEHLDAGDWHYEPLDGSIGVRLAVQGRSGTWMTAVLVREEEEQVLVYSVPPFKVPAGKRAEVAELVTRANFDLILGNFELEWDEGEVRFKTSLDIEGDELSPALFERLLDPNLDTFDQYLPALLAVLHAGATPAEAIAEVEAGFDEDGDLDPGDDDGPVS